MSHLVTALGWLLSGAGIGVQAVCSGLDPTWIEEALVATGKASMRNRRLPNDMVVWLVLGMALMRDKPIHEVVDQLELVTSDPDARAVARSSISEARARVGDEPLAWLFSKTADAWAHKSAEEDTWRGLALYGQDGTTLCVPDSDENRQHYGGPMSGRGESGYPQVRLVALMALRTHLIAAVAFGPYEMSEAQLASELWSHLTDNSLTIVDRAFFGANKLIPLAAHGHNRHWLTRAKSNANLAVVKRLGAGDHIVEMKVSAAAKAKAKDLPDTWQMRAIRYQRKGFRPGLLLTSMLDGTRYPAAEIVALYHERWEIELAYDNVKTELLDGEPVLRSRTRVGVSQELFGVLLVHNLIRLEMARVAAEIGVSPLRISFSYALNLIQTEWQFFSITRSPGAIPKHLERMRRNIARLVLPPRRERHVLRGVKIKMSKFKRIRPGDRAAARRRAP